ncbi:MAG TPA: nuclear transport factor 2 family protein [Herbaspirillum sp.]|jgi:hypothetical protein
MHEDILAIEAAAKTFLDGLSDGDADKLASVFHASSVYDLASPSNMPFQEELLRSASAKAEGFPRHDKIVQIYQASPTTAFVTLECAMPPRFFTDYLGFLKVKGDWKVTKRIFSNEMLH